MTPDRWRQISDLFHAAKQRSPAEQDAFVKTACGDDEDLGRDVNSLLRAHHEGAEFGSAPLMLVSQQFQPGSSFGAYRIEGLLGAGGMGEVYRAHDTKLNRDVALKVLPASLAIEPERINRFQREAHVLAALNHPNIAAIYGLEESDGIQALVLELVEGSTLAERIARGPIPPDEALAIAKQIAQALEAAHEQEILHRDLKPSNVQLRPDGAVKVLDFGLAKALDSTQASSSATHSPTITSPAMMTGVGMILGTAAYMSPEQARGKPVDKRADIWAFGCVLYEMLTGRRPFAGDEVSDVLASVLAREPDWTKLPSELSPVLATYLKRCLQKDRKQRIGDIQSVRLALEGAFETLRPIRSSSSIAQLWPWAVAGVLAILLLIAIWRPRTPSSAAQPPMQVEMRLGAGEQLLVSDVDDGALPVLSPDGQVLVYRGTRDSVRRLYVRPLDSLESRPLPGTEGALSPFFSPDGRWVAFFAGGMLKKVDVNGGAPLPIAPAPDARGGTWGPDNTIVFTPTPEAGLYRVANDSGTPSQITEPANNERSHRWPSFLPDGDAVVFMRQDRNAAFDDGLIEAVRLDGTERKILVRGGMFPRYLASGHLAYVRENTLFAVPFDARHLEVRGMAQPVLYGVRSSGAGIATGSSQITFSSTGTAVYIAGSSAEMQTRLEVVDRSGKPLFPLPEKGQFRDPRLSPDGKRVALRVIDGRTGHIYVQDLDRRTRPKVTFEGVDNRLPVWTPDGQQIAYSSNRGAAGTNIFLRRSDSTGVPEQLTTGGGLKVPFSFTSKGDLLAVMQQDATSLDIAVLSLADKQLTPFVDTPANEAGPAFSPNGRWIAYQSDETGSWEVYVRPYPGPGGNRIPISAGGGVQPVWTKNGRELIYLGGPTMNRCMAVDIGVEGNELKPGTPQLLFEMPVAQPMPARWYDVSADGGLFVVLAADDETLTHVTVIFGFFDQVRRMLAGIEPSRRP
jgi:serine/threonine-protein kinase